MKNNFLHNHPHSEEVYNLDEGHVIVDREDWLEARIIFSNPPLPRKQKTEEGEFKKFTKKQLIIVWSVAILWIGWCFYSSIVTIQSWL